MLLRVCRDGNHPQKISWTMSKQAGYVSEGSYDWTMGVYELEGRTAGDDECSLSSLVLEGIESPVPKSEHVPEENDGDSTPLADPEAIPNSPVKLPSQVDPESENASTPPRMNTTAGGVKSVRKTEGGQVDSFFPRKATRRTKKPPGVPKRPLTAYNYFFKAERHRLLQKNKHDKASPEASGKMSFEFLGKFIGSKWSKLDENQRRIYRALADRDLARYHRELEEHENARMEPFVRRVSESNDNAPLSPSAPEVPGPTHYRRFFARELGHHSSANPFQYDSLQQVTTPFFETLPPGTVISSPDVNGIERRFTVNYSVFMVTPEEASDYLAGFPAGHFAMAGPPPYMNGIIPPPPRERWPGRDRHYYPPGLYQQPTHAPRHPSEPFMPQNNVDLQSGYYY